MTAVRDYGVPLVDDPSARAGARDRRGRDRVPGRDPDQRHRVRDRDRGVNGRAGCSTWCQVAAETPSTLGFSSRPGLARQHRGHRIGPVPRLRHRAAHHPAASGDGCWTRSPSFGSGSTPWTRSAAGCSTRPPGTAAAGDDPLYRIRRVLRRGFEHHSQRSWDRLLAGLDAGDVDEQIGRAWIAAQELRLLYREPDRDRAERWLLRWFTVVAEHESPSCCSWHAPSTAGGRSCSPTSTPAASRTVLPRRSTG